MHFALRAMHMTRRYFPGLQIVNVFDNKSSANCEVMHNWILSIQFTARFCSRNPCYVYRWGCTANASSSSSLLSSIKWYDWLLYHYHSISLYDYDYPITKCDMCFPGVLPPIWWVKVRNVFALTIIRKRKVIMAIMEFELKWALT